MFNQSNAEKLYKWMKKKGLAQIVVDIAPHANDQDFIQCPITCRVTVVSTKEGDVTELKRNAKWKKLSYGKQQSFTVGVEGIQGVLGLIGKWWNKKDPEIYEVYIFGEPLGDFANHYEPYTKILVLRAGDTEEETLLFKPKKSGSRFDRSDFSRRPVAIPILTRKVSDESKKP